MALLVFGCSVAFPRLLQKDMADNLPWQRESGHDLLFFISQTSLPPS